MASFIPGTWSPPDDLRDFKDTIGGHGQPSSYGAKIDTASRIASLLQDNEPPALVGWTAPARDWKQVGRNFLDSWEAASPKRHESRWSIGTTKLSASVAQAMFGYLTGVLLSMGAARKWFVPKGVPVEVILDRGPGDAKATQRFLDAMLKAPSSSELWSELQSLGATQLSWSDGVQSTGSAMADWLAHSMSAGQCPKEWVGQAPSRDERLREAVARPAAILAERGRRVLFDNILGHLRP